MRDLNNFSRLKEVKVSNISHPKCVCDGMNTHIKNNFPYFLTTPVIHLVTDSLGWEPLDETTLWYQKENSFPTVKCFIDIDAHVLIEEQNTELYQY